MLYDGCRSVRLPANLRQAQRDYFGAYTYERVDQPRGQFFHTNWTGRGGATSGRRPTPPDQPGGSTTAADGWVIDTLISVARVPHHA